MLQPLQASGETVAYTGAAAYAEEEITLNGTKWTIFWTCHAANRSFDRHSHPKVAAKALRYTLLQLDSFTDQIIDQAEDQTIILRAYKYGACFVLAFNRELKQIFVVTYGASREFFPKCGDKVITMHINGLVTLDIWSKNGAQYRKAAYHSKLGLARPEADVG